MTPRTHLLHGLDRLHADLAHADMLKVALIPQRDHRVDDVLSGLAGRDTGARVDILRALLAQDRLRLLDLLAPEVETGVSDLPTCTLTAHSSDIVNSGVTHPLITSVILSLYSGYYRQLIHADPRQLALSKNAAISRMLSSILPSSPPAKLP